MPVSPGRSTTIRPGCLLQPAPLLQGLQRRPRRGQQLHAKALAQNFPAGFAADVAAGTLPEVSWIHGPIVQCEHPATAPQWGENLVQTVLDMLTSNPEVWAQTLFILNYDENGGFFDHVPPPVPPAGTRRRVPDGQPACRRPPAASPARSASASGCRASSCRRSPAAATWRTDVFDHTSTLRSSRRASACRCRTSRPGGAAWTGDMTRRWPWASRRTTDRPDAARRAARRAQVDEQIIVNALPGTFDDGLHLPAADLERDARRTTRSPARSDQSRLDECGRRTFSRRSVLRAGLGAASGRPAASPPTGCAGPGRPAVLSLPGRVLHP